MVGINMEYRPWGTFEVLLDCPRYKVKRLIVMPDQRLSDQRHQHRTEHWVVVDGTGILTLGNREFHLSAGSNAVIPRGDWHRVKAGQQGLVVIETQIGECNEGDIERRQDDYGRE